MSGYLGLVASVPFLLGFQPTESIVLLCMRGERLRVSPILRLDLPTGARAGAALANYLAQQAARHADVSVLLCFTEKPDDRRGRVPILPCAALIRQCRTAFTRAGIEVGDAMLVRGGRVWNYLHETAAHPGDPVLGPDDPQLLHLRAASAGTGRRVLPSREALAASLDGPDEEQTQRRLTLLSERAPTAEGDTAAARIVSATSAIERLWIQYEAQQSLDESLIADVVTAIASVPARDAIIAWAFGKFEHDVVPFLIRLTTWSPPTHVVAISSVLALLAYRAGDGALAQIAVGRAEQQNPNYSLANLLLEMFNGGFPPALLDEIWSGR